MGNLEDQWRLRWLALVQRFETRLADAGLADLAGALREGLRPLGPLASQFLWFSQPGFALFGQSAAVGALAELLDENPGIRHTGQAEKSEDR